MSSVGWYTLLLVLVGGERIAELVVARRNAAVAMAQGAFEQGRAHYPVMVVLHTGFLLACLAEVVLLERPFLPWLGWPAFVVVLLAQALRWWCIATLGHQWNTRVIVVPGAPRVTSGPYRWMRHPNYVAVVLEMAALPLVHTAWLTALVFSAANAILLRERIQVESRALEHLTDPT
jgi:methyltransferase